VRRKDAGVPPALRLGLDLLQGFRRAAGRR